MWEQFKTWLFGKPRCAWCRKRLASYDSFGYDFAGKPCFDKDSDGDPIHRGCDDESRRIDRLLVDRDNERYGTQLKLVHSAPRPPDPERWPQ